MGHPFGFGADWNALLPLANFTGKRIFLIRCEHCSPTYIYKTYISKFRRNDWIWTNDTFFRIAFRCRETIRYYSFNEELLYHWATFPLKFIVCRSIIVTDRRFLNTFYSVRNFPGWRSQPGHQDQFPFFFSLRTSISRFEKKYGNHIVLWTQFWDLSLDLVDFRFYGLTTSFCIGSFWKH